MKSPTLKTQHYTLRPFQKEDAELWQVWDIDPAIQAHMPEPQNEPQDISAQYEYINECDLDEEGYYWSIETNEHVTIGTVSLFEINTHHKNAQIGIVLGDKDFWGKGVASEVIAEVIQYAFNTLEIEYVGAEVEEANLPMQKVLAKVGFSQDGLLKGARVKDGARINVVHFGIGKGE